VSGRAGIPVAPFVAETNAGNRQKAGTVDVELVTNIFSRRVNRCAAWFHGLGWCRFSNRMDFVRSVPGLIPSQLGRRPENWKTF
jgi:hypothetical protein